MFSSDLSVFKGFGEFLHKGVKTIFVNCVLAQKGACQYEINGVILGCFSMRCIVSKLRSDPCSPLLIYSSHH